MDRDVVSERSVRRVRSAEILAVGSELTLGETRDTNGGEIARALAGAGVSIHRIAAVPDALPLVCGAIAEGLGRSDLVVATGGLGPTPDDLTREAIAEVVGESPTIDPGVERWLRQLFERRRLPFAEANRKQAWLIPSAVSIPNSNGTAPGWWVERPDGRLLLALPGPPREMRAMWRDWVLPRLQARGLGEGRVVRTLRTTGIGESLVVDRLGEAFLRRPNPIVATYARADSVDVRISAVDEATGDGGRSALAVVDEADRTIRAALAGHIWAEGEASWGDVLADVLGRRGWHLAVVEAGTRGALGGLLADVPTLRRSTSHADEAAGAFMDWDALEAVARAAASEAGTGIGLALAAVPEKGDMRAHVALVTQAVRLRRSRLVFLGGPQGRLRAAVFAASVLWHAAIGARPDDPQASAG